MTADTFALRAISAIIALGAVTILACVLLVAWASKAVPTTPRGDAVQRALAATCDCVCNDEPRPCRDCARIFAEAFPLGSYGDRRV